MRLFIILISLIILLAVTTKSTHAADCEVVYGGGETECVKAQTVSPVEQEEEEPTATPTHSTSSGQATPPAAQSKGGLPIQKAPESKTTPATGPEAFALMSLIPMAAVGMWLRRKNI